MGRNGGAGHNNSPQPVLLGDSVRKNHKYRSVYIEILQKTQTFWLRLRIILESKNVAGFYALPRDHCKVERKRD